MKKKIFFLLGAVYSVFLSSSVAFSLDNNVNQASQPSFLQAILQMLPLCIAMYFIFYFVVTKPQEKKRKELEKMVSELKRGDEILTTSGICGKVFSLDGDFVNVEVTKGVNIKFSKQSVIKKL